MAGDFELTTDELRAVARYVAETAAEVLPLFEAACPDDLRPRLALDAAWEFVGGARRTKLQRVTSLDAHRAAKEAPSEAARLAARSAGDAAAAAYLHPLADAAQVAEISEPGAAVASLDRAVERASPVLLDVLARYPVVPAGKNRVADLMSILDSRLRASG